MHVEDVSKEINFPFKILQPYVYSLSNMEDNPIPWHLGIHSDAMGRDAPASSLMFEHTRLTIRVIAFMYQKHRDWDMPMGMKEDRANKVLEDLKSELIKQVNKWKPKMFEIAVELGKMSGGKATKAIERFSKGLVRHIKLIITIAESKFKGNEEKMNKAIDQLTRKNARFMLNVLKEITQDDEDLFLDPWMNHIQCTADYIAAGNDAVQREGDDQTFDILASKCLRNSVKVGVVLDRLVRPIPMKNISSKIEEEPKQQGVYW